MTTYDNMFDGFMNQVQSDRIQAEQEQMQQLAEHYQRETYWQSQQRQQAATWQVSDRAYNDYLGSLDAEQGTDFRGRSIQQFEQAIGDAELRGWMQGFFGQ